jgi:hypothetical protein
MKIRHLLLIGIVVLGVYIGFKPIKSPEIQQQEQKQKSPKPTSYNITKPIPGYLTYEGIKAQLDEWHNQAPEITMVGSYGKTTQGRDIYYFRVAANENKPKVLITACIHGNEHIANACVMGILGNYLKLYGKDQLITELINERDVYWVPVVSPDSFVSVDRHVDGVDPNRNFPYPGHATVNSVPPVMALRKFHEDKKFKAAISSHAYGRVLLYPYGYTANLCPDVVKYMDLLGRMGKKSGYDPVQTHFIQTARPYHGFECDWFYLNNCFGMVCEFGTEFKPPANTIIPEINRTFDAFMLFISEAPEIKISPPALR